MKVFNVLIIGGGGGMMPAQPPLWKSNHLSKTALSNRR